MRCWTLLFALTTVLGCSSKSPPSPLVVGQVANLSGPGSRADVQASRGIRLALDEVNKDAERKIIVRHTDTQGKLEAYEAQAARLVAFNKVVALFGGDAPEEVVRLDRSRVLAESEQPGFLPVLSPCGRRTPAMSAQVVLAGMTPQAQGKALARFAAENLKITRVTLLVHQGTTHAEPLTEAFVREFVDAQKKKEPKTDVMHPHVLRYGADKDKLSDRWISVADRKPEAVLLAGPESDLRWLRDQAKPADQKILYGGEDGSLRLDEWLGGPGAIYLASAYGVEKENTAGQDFVEKYRKAFDEEPDVHAALGFESMKLWAEALRKAPESESQRRDELFKIKDFAGLVGPLSFDDDHRLQRSLVILRLDAAGQHVFPAKK